jgi:hypothetical protein
LPSTRRFCHAEEAGSKQEVGDRGGKWGTEAGGGYRMTSVPAAFPRP